MEMFGCSVALVLLFSSLLTLVPVKANPQCDKSITTLQCSGLHVTQGDPVIFDVSVVRLIGNPAGTFVNVTIQNGQALELIQLDQDGRATFINNTLPIGNLVVTGTYIHGPAVCDTSNVNCDISVAGCQMRYPYTMPLLTQQLHSICPDPNAWIFFNDNLCGGGQDTNIWTALGELGLRFSCSAFCLYSQDDPLNKGWYDEDDDCWTPVAWPHACQTYYRLESLRALKKFKKTCGSPDSCAPLQDYNLAALTQVCPNDPARLIPKLCATGQNDPTLATLLANNMRLDCNSSNCVFSLDDTLNKGYLYDEGNQCYQNISWPHDCFTTTDPFNKAQAVYRAVSLCHCNPLRTPDDITCGRTPIVNGTISPTNDPILYADYNNNMRLDCDSDCLYDTVDPWNKGYLRVGVGVGDSEDYYVPIAWPHDCFTIDDFRWGRERSGQQSEALCACAPTRTYDASLFTTICAGSLPKSTPKFCGNPSVTNQSIAFALANNLRLGCDASCLYSFEDPSHLGWIWNEAGQCYDEDIAADCFNNGDFEQAEQKRQHYCGWDQINNKQICRYDADGCANQFSWQKDSTVSWTGE